MGGNESVVPNGGKVNGHDPANGSERTPSHVTDDVRRLLAQLRSEKREDAGPATVVDLTVDSVLEMVGLGTDADPAYPRHLTFEDDRWRLDLDISHRGGHRCMDGELQAGSIGQALTVRQAGATKPVLLDGQARFHLDDLVSGPVSLAWEDPDVGSVETTWVSI